MRTTQTLTRSLTVLVLASILGVGASTLLPTQAEGSNCFPFTATRDITGSHSLDCPWAIANFHVLANKAAEDHCGSTGRGVCFFQTDAPQFCNEPNPPFTASGSVSFRCSGIPTPI